MIWIITKYPEYKGFISEETLKDLQKWESISWKFYNFSDENIIDVSIQVNDDLTEWIVKTPWNTLHISRQILEILETKGWIISIKLNCNVIKATLVVKERIQELSIWSDSKKYLEWSVQIVDDLVKENYEKRLGGIFQK
jgi:hypothetical protein